MARYLSIHPDPKFLGLLTISVVSSYLPRVTIDAALTFARQFLAGLMGLGLVLLIARSLGADGAGTFSVALLLPTIMIQLLNFGLVSANVYFIASEQISLARAWAATRDLVLCAAIGGFLLAAVIIALAGDRIFPGVGPAALYYALLVFPFGLLANLAIGIFQAQRDFRTYNVLIIMQPALALLVACVLWSFSLFRIELLICAVAFSHAIRLCVALSYLARVFPVFACADCRRADYLVPALKYGIKAHLSNVLTFLNYRLDLFLVNFFVGPVAAGLYTIAGRLVEQLWLVSQAVSTVLYPLLASLHADEHLRRQLTATLARLVLWISFAGAVVLQLARYPMVEGVFGADFHDAAVVLSFLLPGVVVLSSSRILANDLAARGLVGVNLAFATLVLIVNLTGNLFLIPSFGIVGAAVATSFAYFVDFGGRLMTAPRLSGIPPRLICFLQAQDFAYLLRGLRLR